MAEHRLESLITSSGGWFRARTRLLVDVSSCALADVPCVAVRFPLLLGWAKSMDGAFLREGESQIRPRRAGLLSCDRERGNLTKEMHHVRLDGIF